MNWFYGLNALCTTEDLQPYAKGFSIEMITLVHFNAEVFSEIHSAERVVLFHNQSLAILKNRNGVLVFGDKNFPPKFPKSLSIADSFPKGAFNILSRSVEEKVFGETIEEVANHLLITALLKHRVYIDHATPPAANITPQVARILQEAAQKQTSKPVAEKN